MQSSDHFGLVFLSVTRVWLLFHSIAMVIQVLVVQSSRWLYPGACPELTSMDLFWNFARTFELKKLVLIRTTPTHLDFTRHTRQLCHVHHFGGNCLVVIVFTCKCCVRGLKCALHWTTHSDTAHQNGASKIILMMTSGELGQYLKNNSQLIICVYCYFYLSINLTQHGGETAFYFNIFIESLKDTVHVCHIFIFFLSLLPSVYYLVSAQC